MRLAQPAVLGCAAWRVRLENFDAIRTVSLCPHFDFFFFVATCRAFSLEFLPYSLQAVFLDAASRCFPSLFFSDRCSSPIMSCVQKRVVPEISEEFAQSIRKGLTLAELTKEVEQAVMEESGNSVKDARNKYVNRLGLRWSST